jgi:nucleotide-binding universal stress UspA family protein
MKRIRVGYDDDAPAQLALERAAELADAFDAELGVISVTPWRRGRVPVDPWDDAEAHAKALETASNWLEGRGLRARLYSPAGDPGRAILQVAERDGFDTIVVGSRGLGPIGRLMQGSLSERLATDAKVTVVVAR